jgi:hypothetical protein
MNAQRASRSTRPGLDRSGPPARGGRPALIAGIIYSAAWVIGLTVWPTNLDVHASDTAVLATYAGHAAAASTQATLVHGIAALTLAIVVIALARAGRSAGVARESSVVAISGLAAAAVSLIQWVLDLTLADVIAPSGDAARAGLTLEAINRLDGVKMLLLAAFAVAGVMLVRHGVLPPWLMIAGGLLAIAITASGIGYASLISPLALLAYASGPLLLIWVSGVGVEIWRRSQ